jgi:hypothetical protein
MAKTSTLHEYARIGAAVRIKELQAEMAEIRRAFPGLDGSPARRGPGRPKIRRAAPAPEPEGARAEQPKRKRRKMSAAARKAIGDAQQRRWAKLKKANTA